MIAAAPHSRLPRAELFGAAEQFTRFRRNEEKASNLLTSSLPGTFHVTPANGTELDSVFSYCSLRWFDDELPLSYEFGYLSFSDTPRAGRWYRAASPCCPPALTAERLSKSI